MPTLKKIPDWIINADKDLLKYKPVEKLAPEEPVISNDEEPKVIVKKEAKAKKPTRKNDEYSSDDGYKPKKKKIPTKKKYESESEEESEDSDESDYEARISKCKNLKKYFKK